MIDWFEQHMLACAFKEYFGVECPGCGLQRSVIALLKGDLILSITLYPALLPALFTFILLLFQLKFKLSNGGLAVMYSFSFTCLLVILNYINNLI